MAIIDTIYVLKDSFRTGCQIFKILLSLRLTFAWFPNFNTYQQPLYFLAQITDPYFAIFSNIFPPIFGLDLSHLVAIQLLNCV
jgi:uncharacterized protein YggT (Ycf19 family)